MTPPLTTLIHLTGFATGIVLYTMLLVMTSRPSALPRARAGGISLPTAAAGLGLVWNAGALVLYGLRDFGLGQPAGWLVAASFAALGFLPAVVVHSTQEAAVVGWRRVIVPVAYTLSASAALFFARGATVARPSETALLVLTGGYLLLVSLVALDGRREGEGWRRRVVTMVALAAFAAAAFHLGHDVGAPDSWLVALLGHHGSIPLGLVILYLDYRFAFADLFLRRALTLVFLVATALLLHVGVATPLMANLGGAGAESLLATAGHIGLWVLTALCYPPLHRLSSVIVDRVVLRRGDYRQLVDDLRFVTSQAATEDEALAGACGLVEDALGADRIPVRGRFDAQVRPPAHPQVVLGPDGAHAVRLLVPTTEGPTAIVEVGPLPPGRRLLSDDVALLDRVGTMLARRLDAQRVARER
ncbi:MAG: hypothetical protein JNJ98_12565, partial [Gemmatimonadetes bacterium]|nr:hypothetical protein [Gemmatimonadota bacterium]